MRNKAKSLISKVLVTVLTVATVATSALAGLNTGVVESQAAELAHVKATKADVVSKATNKNAKTLKGAQGTEFEECGETLASINMDAMFWNVDLARFVNTKGKGALVYTMSDGTKYYVDESTLDWMFNTVKYRAQGATCNFCLLLSWKDHNGVHDAGLEKLMAVPDGSVSHPYYGWNVADKNSESYKALKAIVDFLTEKYSYQDSFVQNWWVNNEVNVANNKIYYMKGQDADNFKVDKKTLETLTFNSFDLLYDSLKENNPAALAYISVEHGWNDDNGGAGIPMKQYLIDFAQAELGKNWNVDLHANPPATMLHTPETCVSKGWVSPDEKEYSHVWQKGALKKMSHDDTTPVVCAANLDVFIDFIRSMYGNHRIIMSEQSFNSENGAEEQAAMVAYTYKVAQECDLIDEVIFATYKDAPKDSISHDGILLGFVENNGTKKPSYNVFKLMNQDTAEAKNLMNSYLAKLTSWVGRDVNSWSVYDSVKKVNVPTDILYKIQPTNDTLYQATVDCYDFMQADNRISLAVGGSKWGPKGNDEPNKFSIEYKWDVTDPSGVTTEVKTWTTDDEWLHYNPTQEGQYVFKATLRAAGNKKSVITAELPLYFKGRALDSAYSPIASAVVDNNEGEGAKANTELFNDVIKNKWYSEGIKCAYFNGIMTGYKDKEGNYTGSFGTDDTLTRGQFATMIYRMEGCPAVTYTGKFPDVPAGKYYSEAVEWCASQGIITGYTSGQFTGLFGTNDAIERQQLATIFCRYAAYKGYNISDKKDLSVFPDAGRVAGYAKEQMAWCVQQGIITGSVQNGVAYLLPKDSASRAQCATMIQRFMKYSVENLTADMD